MTRTVLVVRADRKVGGWSFYIFSGCSSVKQGLIGDLETERGE